MDKINNAIAKIISRLRHEREISQEELADKADIHRTYVSQIERGLKSPTLPVLIKIAKALNTTASHILIGIEKEINEL